MPCSSRRTAAGPTGADVSLPLLVAADQVGVEDRRRRRSPAADDGLGRRRADVAGGRRRPAGRHRRRDRPDKPDRLLFASESRLFLSEDGGLFWRSLAPELIGITAVEFS